MGIEPLLELLEVAAGEDALALKKRYGKDIVLVGNVDKRALIRGEAEIDREVAKVRALLAQGGYFPAVDHSVPPDVPLESFLYFLRRLGAALADEFDREVAALGASERFMSFLGKRSSEVGGSSLAEVRKKKARRPQ